MFPASSTAQGLSLGKTKVNDVVTRYIPGPFCLEIITVKNIFGYSFDESLHDITIC